MGTSSSVRIIEDVDLALKSLEIIFYRASGAAVEGIPERNAHICKEVGEGKRVSWGCARTKGEGCECKLTKKIFFHSDF